MEAALTERSLARLSTSDPNLLIRLSELVGIAALRSLWTWLALVLATIATLRRRLKKTRNSAIHLTTGISPAPSPEPRIPFRDFNFESRSTSSSSLSSLEEEDEFPMRIGGCIEEFTEYEREQTSEVRWEEMPTGRAVVKVWSDERLGLRVGERELQMLDQRRGTPVVGRWEMRGMRTRVAGVGSTTREGTVVYVEGEDGETLALDVRNGRWVPGDDDEAWYIDGNAAMPTMAAWSRFGFWT